jgi:hypothetical protein
MTICELGWHIFQDKVEIGLISCAGEGTIFQNGLAGKVLQFLLRLRRRKVLLDRYS